MPVKFSSPGIPNPIPCPNHSISLNTMIRTICNGSNDQTCASDDVWIRMSRPGLWIWLLDGGQSFLSLKFVAWNLWVFPSVLQSIIVLLQLQEFPAESSSLRTLLTFLLFLNVTCFGHCYLRGNVSEVQFLCLQPLWHSHKIQYLPYTTLSLWLLNHVLVLSILLAEWLISRVSVCVLTHNSSIYNVTWLLPMTLRKISCMGNPWIYWLHVSISLIFPIVN